VKKQHLEHLLRAAGKIVGDHQFIVIGSQSLHGKYPDLADDLIVSFEADLISKNRPNETDRLNSIGIDSPFHHEFGFYADPVDINTAILPKGWQGRLVNLESPETDGVTGLCLEPHDLAISKYVARREKDILFNREIVRRGLLNKSTLLELLNATDIPDERRHSIKTFIESDFVSNKVGSDSGIK
jgi:hypothetical protein